MTELKPTDRLYQVVQARLAGTYQAMAAGDLERLLELYLPDALIQSSGQAPVQGIAAIRALWLGMFDKYRVEMVPQVEEVTALGDVVVVRGRAAGRFAPKSGDAALPIDIWFLQIYRADADGTLRVLRGANGPNP
jgi:ketosteroid isomerase-like protein